MPVQFLHYATFQLHQTADNRFISAIKVSVYFQLTQVSPSIGASPVFILCHKIHVVIHIQFGSKAVLTLLANSNFAFPRSGLFNTLKVFLKEFLEKVNFEKKSAELRQQKHAELSTEWRWAYFT